MHSNGGQDKLGIWLRHQDTIFKIQDEDPGTKDNF